MPTTRTVTSNILWRLLERTGAQGVTFIVSLILARLLDPQIYGLIAIVSVITGFLSIFIDCGCGTALIQKKDADELDFSSVFIFNITTSIIIFIIIFLIAPYIQNYYHNENLALYVRVSAINLLFGAAKSIQSTIVAKELIYKKFFFSTLLGTVCAAITGIIMAFMGFGIWALIIQGLVNNAIDTIVLWLTVHFKPKMIFSWKRIKELILFSWKLVVISLSSNIFETLKQLCIGKIYSSTDLAYYNRGTSYPNIFSTNLNSAIESVVYPSMAKEQDNPERLKQMTRRAVKTTSYIIFPTLLGLALCAKPLISLIITDKWLKAADYMYLFCFIYALYPLQTSNIDALKVLGKVDIIFRNDIIKILLNFLCLMIFIRFDLLILLTSFLCVELISFIIYSFTTRRLIHYGFFAQFKDLFPNFLITILMGSIVFAESFIPVSNLYLVLIQVPTGILSYFILSKLFHIESYSYLLDVLKNYVHEKPGILQKLSRNHK